MRSEADEIVSAVMAKWSAGFSGLDADALASLYSKRAFFFGSNPSLYRGREGVAAYFNGLPRWHSPRVQFSGVSAALVGAEVVNMAATASFFLDESDPSLTVRMTWVIVREDGDWKIASHHVSSRAPLISQ